MIHTDSIDINPEFRAALDLLEYSNRSVFITGRAGTGKSTLLEYFRSTTGKSVVVLAPTGVAALNVKGQTIHSFFRFKPGITPEKIRKSRIKKTNETYRSLDTIIIDEVSMVRADLMDCIDTFLRLNGPDESKPFGGIQMAFIGDLYQLPPVVTSGEQEAYLSLYRTPYFYGARVFEKFEMDFIELDTIYRQTDDAFIRLLNAIRNNTITGDDIDKLNTRYLPDFTPDAGELCISLTTTNRLAEEINNRYLESLESPLFTFSGKIDGDFKQDYLPTRLELNLKTGSQVMMLNNDFSGRWVNGTVGKIIGFEKNEVDEDVIIAELEEGECVEIPRYTWEIFRYYADSGNLRSEVVGRFTQFPVMLAWAVTIHKSQGKTFNNVIIDTGGGTFADGQMYVALSRCTSLEGVVLKRLFSKRQVRTNFQVAEFLSRFQDGVTKESNPADERVHIIREAIKNKIPLEIVYQNSNNEQSVRTVMPVVVGTMGFRGRTYQGMQAFCLNRKELRSFRLDRILEIR